MGKRDGSMEKKTAKEIEEKWLCTHPHAHRNTEPQDPRERCFQKEMSQ